MRITTLIMLFLVHISSYSDTIDHYIHISSNIPNMEMKADPEAQAWARSARNVLTITTESIAETLLEANHLAQSQGKPLFCLPSGVSLDASHLKNLIEEAFNQTPSMQQEKDKLTVSRVAWLTVTQHYPCHGAQQGTSGPIFANNSTAMSHEDVNQG